MRFTYSVIDHSSDETFVKQLDYPADALTVANLCQLYWENNHIEGDTILTEENFEQFYGKRGEDTLVCGLGLLTIRLTRHMPATQLFLSDTRGPAEDVKWLMFGLV